MLAVCHVRYFDKNIFPIAFEISPYYRTKRSLVSGLSQTPALREDKSVWNQFELCLPTATLSCLKKEAAFLETVAYRIYSHISRYVARVDPELQIQKKEKVTPYMQILSTYLDFMADAPHLRGCGRFLSKLVPQNQVPRVIRPSNFRVISKRKVVVMKLKSLIIFVFLIRGGAESFVAFGGKLSSRDKHCSSRRYRGITFLFCGSHCVM